MLSLWLRSTETVGVSTAKGGETIEGSSIASNEATVGVSKVKEGETTEGSSFASNEELSIKLLFFFCSAKNYFASTSVGVGSLTTPLWDEHQRIFGFSRKKTLPLGQYSKPNERI